jgi:hypothetical protein
MQDMSSKDLKNLYFFIFIDTPFNTWLKCTNDQTKVVSISFFLSFLHVWSPELLSSILKVKFG